MVDYIMEVENLAKKFDKKIILKNINIKFKKGESVAILGKNGVGKSTFLRMLCGLTNISSGKIIVDKNTKFNYIPELYSKLNLTIAQYMKCIKELDNLSDKDFNVKIKALYKEFNLESMEDVPMKHLSKGTLQKVAILQALISKPDILILDEPLTGQDANSQKNFIRFVKDLISQGVTVIMSCHEMFLVEELSTRILKIENQTISQCQQSKLEKVKYKSIIFEKKEESNIQLKSALRGIGEYSEEEELLKLKVIESKSNEILLKMLKDGYILKYFK